MKVIAGLSAIAARYDAVVLDQWGVLHDGLAAYPGAADCVERLLAAGQRIGVLSNSGKRAGPNRDRIARLGLPTAGVTVMTSGEALWADIAAARLAVRAPCILAACAADAATWAAGLDIAPAPADAADAVILMGLPEPAPDRATVPAAAATAPHAGAESPVDAALRTALARGLTLICSNPDIASPRAAGRIVASPGALAARYAARGGAVVWYGKPHRPVFDTCARALGLGAGARILMVGDSPAHDVAGARAAGWDACLVMAGLLRGAAPRDAADLCAAEGAGAPDWALATLRWD